MKKILFTIIILGACLVGSSQNWDSVRVANVDVDSIMDGGAKIWEKPIVTPSTGVLTMTTNSTSATWSPQGVFNSGAILHWEVTGAATISEDANAPTFDFSAPGEKTITITSEDDLDGLQYLDLYNNQLTSFNATGLTGLQELNLYNNQLTTFNATGLANLQNLELGDNQLTSFNATGLTGLEGLLLYNNQLTSFNATGLANLYGLNLGNNQLTSFDATGLTVLQELNLYNNQLTTVAINTMLDQLITIGNTLGYILDSTNQTGGGCGDPAKITALDAIWLTVLVDACP